MKLRIRLMGALAGVAGLSSGYAAGHDLSMYPAAPAGQQMRVIELPPLFDEERFRVEIIPGEYIEKDCNTYALGGEIKASSVEGWGYDYYQVSDLGPLMSTQMACPAYPKKHTFIPAHNASTTIRYNSQLPVVVYAPQGVDVKYRLWATDALLKNAKDADR